MNASSTTSLRPQTYAQRLNLDMKPTIEIIVDGHDASTVYTTGDSISGHVYITAPKDTPFEDVEITLEGTTNTATENMSPAAVNSRIVALHHFLKLVMPLSGDRYPARRIVESGQTYKFPFHFVIPEHLLLSSCKHKHCPVHVKEAHLSLPPSLGRRENIDDLSPEASKIIYNVRAKITKLRRSEGKKTAIAESFKAITVSPATLEAPPLSVDANDKTFTMTKMKKLKKGVFKGKLGKITVSASQPRSFMHPPPPARDNPITTMVTLQLRFDPCEPNSQPPRLGTLASKLQATTSYGTRPTNELPGLAAPTPFNINRSQYSNSVPLTSRSVESATWTKHDLAPQYLRRDSGYSTYDSDSARDPERPPKALASRIHYTAEILVPLTLPKSKIFVPTFHSCLVSRTYALDLALSVHTPGTGVPSTSLSLRLPVHIGAYERRRVNSLASLSQLDVAEAAADVEAMLTPRVLEVPSAEYTMGSVLAGATMVAERELPPGYEDLMAPEQTFRSSTTLSVSGRSLGELTQLRA